MQMEAVKQGFAKMNPNWMKPSKYDARTKNPRCAIDLSNFKPITMLNFFMWQNNSQLIFSFPHLIKARPALF